MGESSAEAAENNRAYLDSLHQQHSLRVILVRFQDEVGQLVDDDIEWTLLLQRLAEVQLEREDSHGSRSMSQNRKAPRQSFIASCDGLLGKYNYVIAAAENWLLSLALQSAGGYEQNQSGSCSIQS